MTTSIRPSWSRSPNAAPRAGRRGEAATRRGRHLFESRPVAIVEEQRALRPGHAPVEAVHLRIDVTVGHEQIEPAIVVVVEKAGAPSEKREGRRAEAGARP